MIDLNPIAPLMMDEIKAIAKTVVESNWKFAPGDAIVLAGGEAAFWAKVSKPNNLSSEEHSLIWKETVERYWRAS